MSDEDESEKWLERLLAEASANAGPSDPAGVPVAGDPAARMAAWLEGTLSGAERDAFERELAAAPAALLDLEAADALLARVDAKTVAPDDLVAAALARIHAPAAPGGVGERLRRFRGWVRARPLWASGGLATLTLACATLVILPLHTGPDAPIAGAPAPAAPEYSINGASMDWPTESVPADAKAAAGASGGDYAYHEDCGDTDLSATAPEGDAEATATGTTAPPDLRASGCGGFGTTAPADAAAAPAMLPAPEPFIPGEAPHP